MSDTKEREAFEAWCRTHCALPGDALQKYVNDSYMTGYVDDMWDGWQARAALSASTEAAGEPVAWRAPNLSGNGDTWAYRDADDRFEDASGNPTGEALYTTPPPAKLSTETVDKPVHKLTDWRDVCAALIDIYDDAMNNAPEDRCYVDGAWKEELDKARSLLAASDSQGGA